MFSKNDSFSETEAKQKNISWIKKIQNIELIWKLVGSLKKSIFSKYSQDVRFELVELKSARKILIILY